MWWWLLCFALVLLSCAPARQPPVTAEPARPPAASSAPSFSAAPAPEPQQCPERLRPRAPKAHSAEAARETWLFSDYAPICCRFDGDVAAEDTAWHVYASCVGNLLPGVRPGNEQHLVTLEPTIFRIKVALEPQQSELTEAQRSTLREYATRAKAAAANAPTIAPVPPHAASKARAQLLAKKAGALLAEEGLPGAEILPSSPRYEPGDDRIELVLTTELPKPRAPRPCVSGVTLVTHIPPVSALRLKLCRAQSCAEAALSLPAASHPTAVAQALSGDFAAALLLTLSGSVPHVSLQPSFAPPTATSELWPLEVRIPLESADPATGHRYLLEVYDTARNAGRC